MAESIGLEPNTVFSSTFCLAGKPNALLVYFPKIFIDIFTLPYNEWFCELRPFASIEISFIPSSTFRTQEENPAVTE